MNREAAPSPSVSSGINVFETLLDEAQRQSIKAPGNDPVIRALAAAISTEPLDSPFMQIIREVANNRFERRSSEITKSNYAGQERRETPAQSQDPLKFNANGISEMFGMLRACICDYIMTSSEGDFSYEGFDEPERWRPVFADMADALNDTSRDDMPAVQLEINLHGKKVQTTLPDRYAPVEIIVQSLRERWPEGIDWLDIGSGILEGPLQLIHKDKYPMNLEELSETITDPIMEGTHPGNSPEKDQLNDDERAANEAQALRNRDLTQKARRLLTLPSLIRYCVATDIQNVYQRSRSVFDRRAVEWVHASLRPGEYQNSEFMRRFNGLLNEDHSKLHFQQADLLDPTMMERFEAEVPVKKFDLISLITVTHQMPPSHRVEVFDKVKTMLKPGGIVLLQDFAFINVPYTGKPVHPKNLSMYSDWFRTPYRYNTYVHDSLHPLEGLQQAFLSWDSRCRRLAMGAARFMVKGELRDLQSIIEDTSPAE